MDSSSVRPRDLTSDMTLSSSDSVVLKYLILLLIVSIPFWILGGTSGATLLPGLPVSALMVVCPVSIAIFFVHREGGYTGVKGFLMRILDAGRLQAWVWMVSLGMMPLVMTLSAYMLWATGTELPPVNIDLTRATGLFLIFFLAAAAEELGWSGFVTHRLLPKHGILLTAAIVGLISILWHLLPLLQVGRTCDWIAWWSVGTFVRRIVIVWMYSHGGHSVFGATLFHTMSNLSWMLFPVQGSHYDPMMVSLALIAVTIPLLAFCRLRSRSMQ